MQRPYFALSLQSLRRLVLALMFGLGVVVAGAAPAHVIIRVPAGSPLPAELAPLLARWQQAGQVTGVMLLTGGRAEKPERTARFEAFAALEFASEAAYEAWQKQAAPSLPAGLIVRRADVLAGGGQASCDSQRSAFVVNTYTPIVPPERFNEFVQGYVRPLYAAMQATGNLLRYTAYLERGELGQVDALNVLEYGDTAALARMVAMKSAVRDQVAAAHPSYLEFDALKDSLRLDGYGTTATQVRPE